MYVSGLVWSHLGDSSCRAYVSGLVWYHPLFGHSKYKILGYYALVFQFVSRFPLR